MATAKSNPKAGEEIELRPDGWARFEAAVGAAAKSGPKHRIAEEGDRRPGSPRKRPPEAQRK